ncbi:MAG: Ditrans,polycis-undecaprenyl-diphosphate synthase ((2E,6E)-farnesyl-diphosphate specific) [Hyphomicrobiaceae bacterium hypho_1]
MFADIPINQGCVDISKADIPTHIAIIMDGNGRWAQERRLPRAIGHRMGVKAVRRTIQAAIKLKVQYLTLYSFSTENWSRPDSEIDDLMMLMKRFISRDLADINRYGVKIRVIGERTNIDPDLLVMIDEATNITQTNTKLNLVLAFNYGSRNEITLAAQRLAKLVAIGELVPSDITPQHLARELHTAGVPDPDLLIRTSGEERLSNFLLWQCAYAEFVFFREYWPDFDIDLLRSAIDIYSSRQRRYGGLRRVKNA